MKKNNTKNSSQVGAIIVLYRPDYDSLRRLLRNLDGQVAHTYVVDNTPELNRASENERVISAEFPRVIYLGLGDNLGIGRAQNEGIRLAASANCDHVFLLDQDSDIPVDIISKLLQVEQNLIHRGFKPGAIGPLFLDIKTGEYALAIRHTNFSVTKVEIPISDDTPVQADYLISSGSLIRMAVISQVGGLRDDLFIDWVDIEWGLRASRHGFTHFISPSTVMTHSIGDAFIHFMGRNICLHNDLRNFYIVRNACHLLLAPKIDSAWRKSILFKLPLWVIFYSVTSKTKFKSFLRLLLACYYGFSGRLGRYK